MQAHPEFFIGSVLFEAASNLIILIIFICETILIIIRRARILKRNLIFVVLAWTEIIFYIVCKHFGLIG